MFSGCRVYAYIHTAVTLYIDPLITISNRPHSLSHSAVILIASHSGFRIRKWTDRAISSWLLGQLNLNPRGDGGMHSAGLGKGINALNSLNLFFCKFATTPPSWRSRINRTSGSAFLEAEWTNHIERSAEFYISSEITASCIRIIYLFWMGSSLFHYIQHCDIPPVDLQPRCNSKIIIFVLHYTFSYWAFLMWTALIASQ